MTTPSGKDLLEQIDAISRHMTRAIGQGMHEGASIWREALIDASLALDELQDGCIGGNPACPCNDSEPCHYRRHEGTAAMPLPACEAEHAAALTPERLRAALLSVSFIVTGVGTGSVQAGSYVHIDRATVDALLAALAEPGT
jgi:hypothetical protein